ncbi:ATPase, partial [Lactobacillus crispatus]|nr:ATPase [Lactobacillus crispatus]
GVSAMMHGLLIFDDADHLLTPFRTWRNNTTSDAAIRLSQLFDFNIPERWSIAHLYQAVLNGEDYLGSAAFMTTLAGYVHWQLSGEKILGIGDASG